MHAEFQPGAPVRARGERSLILSADTIAQGRGGDPICRLRLRALILRRELNARRRAARILIVCPASIIELWQTELASKFGFQFKIFDSGLLKSARRSRSSVRTARVC